MEIMYFYLILINLLYSIKSTSIIIPLETFQTKREDSDYNSLIDDLFNSNLASTIKIGSQLYPLKAFYNTNNPFFFISKGCYIEESSNFDYKSNFNYNRYQSQSFLAATSFDLSFGKSSHACKASENFEFYSSEKKNIKIEKLDFILNEDTNENIPNCLYIGLSENQNKESSFKEMNLISQLKQKNYIKEYIWYITFNIATKYTNNYLLYDPDELINLKGNLIIGDFPHNYDSKNYYKSQLVRTYTILSENIMKWEMKFNKIYYKFNNKEEGILDLNVILDPSNYLIYAPKEYFDSITKNFFQQYLDEEICNLYFFEEYSSINCEKSDKFSIKEIKTFPSLYFAHSKLGYTFEFSYKDLFVEKNNIYSFLIISDNLFYTSGWTIGNILFRKYQFIFNLDTKEIGFYNPILNKEEDHYEEDYKTKGTSSNTILIIILIISLCIISIGLGLFIRDKFYPKLSKKKRANELDDDYEYIIDKNIKDNIKENNQIYDNNKLINNDN